MIRTKQPQLIDAKNNINDIVYFKKVSNGQDDATKTRWYSIAALRKISETQYSEIDITIAVYKESTWMSLFGHLTGVELKDQEDQLLINQIDWVNKHEWTGEEVVPPIKYWGLSAEDFEIVQ